MNKAVRAYIYRIVTAAAPLLVAYGVVQESQVPMWIALAAAVLGTGTAALNTSTKDTPPTP